MKVHLPNYYTLLVEDGKYLCEKFSNHSLIVIAAGEGISGLAIAGKKQSRGGKGIKKTKKKVIV